MADEAKNRRKHARVYRNFMLSYHLKDKAEVSYQMSQVNNISRGGVNFSSTIAFPKGSALAIELKTPFFNDKVHLEGVVLESSPKIQNLIYTVRVEFKDVSAPAAEVLARIEQYAAQQE